MGFTRAELESYRDRPVPDLIGPDLLLLFVGINPGLWTAATRTHFAHPGNRFYPALHASGITDRLIDGSRGLSTADRDHLLDRGIGITNLVDRATARADEVGGDELCVGARRLVGRLAVRRPVCVAVLGNPAYRTACQRPSAVAGLQDERPGGAVLFVLGNPSGLNAHETPASLAASFRAAAGAAGLEGLIPTAAPPAGG